MKVLVLLHVASEGPGTLGDCLISKGIELEVCKLYQSDHLPNDINGLVGVITMGGPMNVHEEEKYPFLEDETNFLRKAINSWIPILGICLGAQMIAKACGAAVRKAPRPELGWSKIRLTSPGRVDPFFLGVSETVQVFQWHEDTFEVPSGGTLLATSKRCRNQAFRYRNAYGLQFHVEVTREMLSDWFGESEKGQDILCQFAAIENDFTQQALKVYSNFVNLMQIGR